MDSSTLKRHKSFQNNKYYREATQLCSQTSDFSVATERFKIQWYLHELELLKN